MMCRRNYPWLLAIITLLASTYLQLPLKVEMQMMVGPVHNVADTGLLLYLIFLLDQGIRRGINYRHPMAKVSFLFLLFLLINGFYDLSKNVLFGDVIRYLKVWAYLSIAFVNVQVNIEDVKKAIKILFWITFVFSIILIIQYILDMELIGQKLRDAKYTTGAKPPSFAIISCCLAFINVFKFSKTVQIITVSVIFLPVLLCMKMSYFTTISLILIAYYLLKRRIHAEQVIKYSIVGVVGAVILFSAFPDFHQRFQETVNQTGVSHSSRKEEGNFSYRIDHFAERLDYVLQTPERCIRGLGYVQERNFHETPFKLGVTNLLGKKAMLDTGDIAWSLLILRLGFMGLLFYFATYFRCLSQLWKIRGSDEIIPVYFVYMLVSIFFMSFGNALIAHSEFFFIPFLIIGCVKK